MSECNITLLDSGQCSHCTGSELDVVEPAWERKDYAQVDLTDNTKFDRRVELDLRPDGDTSVSMSEIYGTHNALRLRRKNYGS